MSLPHATMGGAYKGYLEGLGLGLAVYRDGAPRDRDGALATAWPYAVVQEGIGYLPEVHGDTDDPAAHMGTVEQVQVDLYQLARSMPDAGGRTTVLESYTLPTDLEVALRSRVGLAPQAPWAIYGCTVVLAQRWPISSNVVRHTWTVSVRRDTKRRAA